MNSQTFWSAIFFILKPLAFIRFINRLAYPFDKKNKITTKNIYINLLSKNISIKEASNSLHNIFNNAIRYNWNNSKVKPPAIKLWSSSFLNLENKYNVYINLCNIVKLSKATRG